MNSPPASPDQVAKKIGCFTSALALYTVDFPIFFIESISERHIVIAGGGGSSKTGVHNQINVIELIPTEDGCAAKSVMKYQTPDEIPDAIMTGALMRDRPIAGTRLISGGSNATIYSFNFDSDKQTFYIASYESLRDSKTRAELKSIKYTPGCVLTGGIDGQLTCWNVTDYNNKRVDKEIRAHTKEIDEIDVDMVNQEIVTLSRGEGRFIIWNLTTLKQLKEVSSKSINSSESQSNGVNFVFRSCRYAYDTTTPTSNAADTCLLVACNPIPAKNCPSKICKWRTMKDEEFKMVASGESSVTDSIMALTVSLDGKFVAYGTRSGAVGVLEVKNLRNIYQIDGAHHNAVTGLEFLPPRQESLTLTNSHSCPLLSVSIDRRIILHRPKTQPLSMSLLLTFVSLLVIYLIIFILDYQYDILSYFKWS